MTNPKCGATNRQGQPCDLKAGWGTDHVGTGNCRKHGGNTPNGRRSAEKQIAREAVQTLGLPREIDPHDALLEEVYRTAGHVAWLGEVVAGIERESLVHGVVKTVQDARGGSVEMRAAVNVWVRLYQDERDRLVRVAKAAVDAGVAERQVEIAEGQARQLARVVTAVLTDLGHDPADDEVRRVVRLRLLEGGQEAA